MSIELSGRVLFANDVAAMGVNVRVFEKNAPGKADDDLTATPGLSDTSGHFTAGFEPPPGLDTTTINLLGAPISVLGRALSGELRIPDPADVLSLYLQFTYTFDGQPCTHTTPVVLFQNEFRLPETAPLQFTPSVHGFQFVNSFPGYPLPFSVPALPFLPPVSQPYGLCGGMSSAAYDFYLAGRRIPPDDKPPDQGSPLHRYLYRRSIDTFGPLGGSIVRVAQWMALPDDTMQGTQKRTWDEFDGRVRTRLDAQHAVVLALVYNRAGPGFEIWNNHQVLAIGYTAPPAGGADIRIYDPNFPNRDDVVIRTEQVQVGTLGRGRKKTPVWALKCSQWLGDSLLRDVRGFFAMPYVRIEPPEDF